MGRRRPGPHRAPRPGAHAAGRGVRARSRRPLHAPHAPPVLGRPGRIPAGLLHDEVQPQALRRRRVAPRPHRRAPGRACCSHPGVDGAARRPGGHPLSHHGHARGHPATAGRCRRRADRPAADARVAHPPRPDPYQGGHPRLRARHQPRVGDARRLSDGDGSLRPPRLRRPRGVEGAARRRRRGHHADEPQHARALRGGHRRNRARGARRRWVALLRRGQSQRDPRCHPTRRHGVRHRPHEPAQDLRGPARWRWPRRRPGRGLGTTGAVPSRPATGCG